MKNGTSQILEKTDKFLHDWISRIIHLGLNQKQSNAVFNLCRELIGEFADVSIQLKDENSGFSFKEIITTLTDLVKNKFSSYNSTYKYKSVIEKKPFFVSPIEKALGTLFEMKRSTDSNAIPRVVQSKMQYVPIVDTIRSLFLRDDFRETFFETSEAGKHQCVDGVYIDFCCGSVFKNSDFYQNNRFCLQIQIATDDFEICNPLQSKSGLHKICAIYFTIRNLPVEYLSRLDNIFLVALCYSDDLKNEQCDFNNLWQLVVDDVKILETEGINLECGTNVKGSISYCTFDNLGAHTSMGFAGSFGCDFNCRFCENTSREYQNIKNEGECRLRTEENYAMRLKAIESLTKVDYKVTFGIKRKCILNNLKHFHMLQNRSVDIMHDLNEGVLPKLMTNLFKYFIDSKIFTEKNLSNMIQYFDYGEMYGSNVPSNISLVKANLNQNATQSKCLFFHLPFILFKYRDNEKFEDVWILVECLLRITQTVYSKKLTEENLISLEKDVATFIYEFRNKFSATITPKIHLMVHYANTIRQMGPVVHMSAIRFESKHKNLKGLVSKTSNFKNILQSLAVKHQELLLLKENTFVDQLKCGIELNLSANETRNYECILSSFDVMKIKKMKWFTFNGYRYKKKVLICHNHCLYEVCEILSISSEIHLICVSYDIIRFDDFTNSFQICATLPVEYELVKFDNIEIKKPWEKKQTANDLYVLADTLDLIVNIGK